MSIILEKEISFLKKELLNLSSLVETNVENAITSLENLDSLIAERVIQKDHEIDIREIQIEEECLKVLALHQPVATDLRYIVAILKINNDLERIGDLAVNIAKRCFLLTKNGIGEIKVDFSGIAQVVKQMLKESLDALMNINVEKAREVCRSDDKVDELNKTIYNLVKDEILANPQSVTSLLEVMNVSKSLERIADHATNIAEDIIYMAEGAIVRHHHLENK